MTPDTSMVYRELAPGERVLWQGAPPTGFRVSVQDVFLIPFSLVWCGFVVFAATMSLRDGVPGVAQLFLLPFLAIGLHMVAGRFFVDAWRRRRTEYVVTNERVIIRSGIFGREVKSLSLALLTEVTFRERRDGSGTIELGSAKFPGGSMMSRSWPGAARSLPPAIEDVPDARFVYDLIRKGQRTA